ncbi:putative UDP-N-acetylglucosamine--peptide N-acetylglucosaminyltransferase SPINDLY, partial [Dissostichus eleginoides]
GHSTSAEGPTRGVRAGHEISKQFLKAVHTHTHINVSSNSTERIFGFCEGFSESQMETPIYHQQWMILSDNLQIDIQTCESLLHMALYTGIGCPPHRTPRHGERKAVCQGLFPGLNPHNFSAAHFPAKVVHFVGL